jgi:hypothetical protein
MRQKKGVLLMLHRVVLGLVAQQVLNPQPGGSIIREMFGEQLQSAAGGLFGDVRWWMVALVVPAVFVVARRVRVRRKG